MHFNNKIIIQSVVLLGILFLAACGGGGSNENVPPGNFVLTNSLNVARLSHTATLLQNGKVLVAGGSDDTQTTLASAELYDPSTNMWSITGSMATTRFGHTATLLPNGKVLVVGGSSGVTGPGPLVSAELYDPTTGLWASTGSLTTARCEHTSTLLPNGKVLVAGGRDFAATSIASVASAELYDPSTGLWTVTGNLNTARRIHTATLLSNGKILVSGGEFGITDLASAELYEPSTGLWTTTGNLATARDSHAATLLPNGKVLVTNGSYLTLVTPGVYDQILIASAELYDPTTGLWTATGSSTHLHASHAAILLPIGKVIVLAGSTNAVDLYDPNTGLWSSTGNLQAFHTFFTATLLANGKVLIAGGNGLLPWASSSAELYW